MFLRGFKELQSFWGAGEDVLPTNIRLDGIALAGLVEGFRQKSLRISGGGGTTYGYDTVDYNASGGKKVRFCMQYA